MFQFSLRELVLLTALVATLLGWWLDKSVVRTRYQTEANRNRTIASQLFPLDIFDDLNPAKKESL